MKRIMTVLSVATVLLSSVLCVMAQAQEMPLFPPLPRGERPSLTEMTVTGKVVKMEMQCPCGNTTARYVLTDTAGNTVMLPGKNMGPSGNKQATSVNLENYVDKNVTIVGKGFQMEKDGKIITCIVLITKIDGVTVTTQTRRSNHPDMCPSKKKGASDDFKQKHKPGVSTLFTPR